MNTCLGPLRPKPLDLAGGRGPFSVLVTGIKVPYRPSPYPLRVPMIEESLAATMVKVKEKSEGMKGLGLAFGFRV